MRILIRDRKTLALMAAGLAALLAQTPAMGTTVRRMDLAEMVSRADRVVHARALTQNVHWDTSFTQIYTDTVFEVIDEAKGQGPQTLTVTLLGGRIDPVEVSAEGTPAFQPGDEVVLFTSPRPDGMKNIVGFMQGVLRVQADPSTGDRMAVSQAPAGVTFMQSAGGHLTRVNPTPRRARLTDLLDDVRRITSGAMPAGPTVQTTPETLDTQTAPPTPGKVVPR